MNLTTINNNGSKMCLVQNHAWRIPRYGVHHDLGVSLVESRFLGCQLCTFLWDNLTEEERDLIIFLDLIRLYDASEQGTSRVYYHPVRGYAPTRSTTQYVISEGIPADGYRLKYMYLGQCRNPVQPELVKTFSLPPEQGSYTCCISRCFD